VIGSRTVFKSGGSGGGHTPNPDQHCPGRIRGWVMRQRDYSSDNLPLHPGDEIHCPHCHRWHAVTATHNEGTEYTRLMPVLGMSRRDLTTRDSLARRADTRRARPAPRRTPRFTLHTTRRTFWPLLGALSDSSGGHLACDEHPRTIARAAVVVTLSATGFQNMLEADEASSLAAWAGVLQRHDAARISLVPYAKAQPLL
jgi:hypothetical protein